MRSITSGGRSCRQQSPISIPTKNRASAPHEPRNACALTNREEHLSQNLRLVQTRQRTRTILSPHSQQKLGR